MRCNHDFIYYEFVAKCSSPVKLERDKAQVISHLLSFFLYCNAMKRSSRYKFSYMLYGIVLGRNNTTNGVNLGQKKIAVVCKKTGADNEGRIFCVHVLATNMFPRAETSKVGTESGDGDFEVVQGDNTRKVHQLFEENRESNGNGTV